jgi:hypothetical protein
VFETIPAETVERSRIDRYVDDRRPVGSESRADSVTNLVKMINLETCSTIKLGRLVKRRA